MPIYWCLGTRLKDEVKVKSACRDMAADHGEFDIAGWSSYFDVIIQLLEEAETVWSC